MDEARLKGESMEKRMKGRHVLFIVIAYHVTDFATDRPWSILQVRRPIGAFTAKVRYLCQLFVRLPRSRLLNMLDGA